MKRRTTYREQARRTRELDDLRIQRGLTPEEKAEADDLADKLYQRLYRLVS